MPDLKPALSLEPRTLPAKSKAGHHSQKGSRDFAKALDEGSPHMRTGTMRRESIHRTREPQGTPLEKPADRDDATFREEPSGAELVAPAGVEAAPTLDPLPKGEDDNAALVGQTAPDAAGASEPRSEAAAMPPGPAGSLRAMPISPPSVEPDAAAPAKAIARPDAQAAAGPVSHASAARGATLAQEDAALAVKLSGAVRAAVLSSGSGHAKADAVVARAPDAPSASSGLAPALSPRAAEGVAVLAQAVRGGEDAAPAANQSEQRDQLPVTAGRAETLPAASAATPLSVPAPQSAQALASSIAEAVATPRIPVSVPAESAQRPAPVQSLRLQLQPVELGMVNAVVSLRGDRLQVEIGVEQAHAHARLASERETIEKALKALGFEVDRVTIHLSAPSNPAAGRDAPSFDGSQAGSQPRGDAAQFGDGGRRDDGSRPRGQHSFGEEARHANDHALRDGAPGARGGGDLYI